MKTIYVFEEYRDSMGTVTEKTFDNKDKAVKYARIKWDRLSIDDKSSYISDILNGCGWFMVYRADIPDDCSPHSLNLSKYMVGIPIGIRSII